MNQDIKDALYAIAISTINIVFKIPALAVYDVFLAPIIMAITWIFNLESKPKEKPVNIHYEETTLNRDGFFQMKVDVEEGRAIRGTHPVAINNTEHLLTI